MRKIALSVVLLLAFAVAGCLSAPQKTFYDEQTGQLIQLTPEQRLIQLEREAAQKQATIDSLEESAGFLPSPISEIALGALAFASAALERQRRKLKQEIDLKTPVPDAT